ncbi:hypothetical protein EDD15DRAFT_2192334 [Pisolithus albus]|nr:hypothetical protein EDD15DRAFT_2192334 [Pisolithus albus]
MYSDLLLTLSALSVVEQSCGILTHKLATEEWYLVFSGLVVTPEEPYLYCSFEQLMYFVAGSDRHKPIRDDNDTVFSKPSPLDFQEIGKPKPQQNKIMKTEAAYPYYESVDMDNDMVALFKPWNPLSTKTARHARGSVSNVIAELLQ